MKHVLQFQTVCRHHRRIYSTEWRQRTQAHNRTADKMFPTVTAFQKIKYSLFHIHLFYKIIFRPAYAGFLNRDEKRHNNVFVLSLRSRFDALRLRCLDKRFVRFHAFRPDNFAAEGQTRADTRIRIRSIVTRIRNRHTAIRTRIAAPAIDHTAY